MPFGSHGRYLRVDAGLGSSELRPLDESTLRRYLGGVGLGCLIVARETAQGVSPLGSQAALVFALSPLVGTPLTTSAKFAVVAFSPLTGRICDALSSSHFALAAKRAGVDAICLTGACDAPRVLLIDGQGHEEPVVTWRDGADLWGRSASEAETILRREIGPDWQVAAIGPAGEALIPFATISHDGRHAGRGGLGAVMGSKRIKAIAVRGDRRTPLADPAATLALARDFSARSFGPATEKYRELGTVANLLVFNRFDALPTRNFTSGHFEGAEALALADLAPARRIARNSCAACTIGCEHVYASDKGGVRLEYESLFALGPLCGIDDPAIVLEAARLCDEQGLDTISTGGTIAFLMDCATRGWIEADWLRFGNGVSLLKAVSSITSRSGPIGELLSLGSRRAAERIGGEAPSLAMQVKGMELPGYDPRVLHAMALGLAVGTRGADHNRSGAYEADFSAKVDRRAGGLDSALAAVETEDRAALIDSMILCKFLRGVFQDFYAESAQMLQAVTGWDIRDEELRETARRIVELRKRINQREGWTRAEDTLPSRLLSEGSGLSAERLNRMIEAYYQARGWDDQGRADGPEVEKSA